VEINIVRYDVSNLVKATMAFDALIEDTICYVVPKTSKFALLG